MSSKFYKNLYEEIAGTRSRNYSFMYIIMYNDMEWK